jgi:hypothetical protein
METLMTIKSIDINDVKINKTTPNTSKRTRISKDILEKLKEFTGDRKASIDIEKLKQLKPNLNPEKLSEYEENFSLEQIFKKLGKSNAILVNKFGYTNLDVSPETLEKAVTESLQEPLKIIEELQEENAKLQEENANLKEIVGIKDNENNVVNFKYYLDDNNLDDLSYDMDDIDDDIKLIA